MKYSNTFILLLCAICTATTHSTKVELAAAPHEPSFYSTALNEIDTTSTDEERLTQAVCEDTSALFEVVEQNGKTKMKGCDWVAEMKTNWRCDRPGVRTQCPVTCDACCKDNEDKYGVTIGTFKGDLKTCMWAGEKARPRCNDPAAQEACPFACGMCPSHSTPPTPSPLNNPIEGDGCDSKYYELPRDGPISTFPPPVVHIFSMVAGFETWAKYISMFETPIALRFTHLIDVMNWNCAAIYSSKWKDSLTKSDPIFHTPEIVQVGKEEVQLHSSDTRLLCMVNAWATVIEDWIPEAKSDILDHLDQFLYPDIQSGWNSDVDSCFSLDTDGAANADCLQDVAGRSCFAPSVIGSIVGREINEYAKRDGWNMYGDLNSDGSKCEANCRRYLDPTAEYNKKQTAKTEKHNIFKSKESSPSTQWKPLLEDNGFGYFTYQEHVTPHIGFVAETVLLTRDAFESRYLDDPNYDYEAESDLVIERMSNLDDAEKMIVEFFDDKIKLAFTLIPAIAMLGTSFEQLLNYIVGYTAVEYDSILLAWKEKMKHNLVRPTTWIKENIRDETITTWAGPNAGIKDFPGKNFEAYIRVMPHSEYVSGSACLCQVVYEFTDSWIMSNLGIADSIPIELKFDKFSSKVEAGVSPTEDITVNYENMFAFKTACGDSRLKGGMHFTKSVPDAYELCEGVGYIGEDYTAHLWGE